MPFTERGVSPNKLAYQYCSILRRESDNGGRLERGVYGSPTESNSRHERPLSNIRNCRCGIGALVAMVVVVVPPSTYFETKLAGSIYIIMISMCLFF